MSRTKIDWADAVWNPITGCSPVSAGCDHCYARRMATRLAGRYGYPRRNPFAVTFHEDRLRDPLRWKTPRRIFVCSMGDLFHESVSFEPMIRQVFWRIGQVPRHTYIILTKRPERMAKWLSDWTVQRNVWLGVSVENQTTVHERIPMLLRIAAALRWVSVEPMLGPVKLSHVKFPLPNGGFENVLHTAVSDRAKEAGIEKLNGVEWVVCGAETGAGARPMELSWARDLRDECKAAGVPFFFKSAGPGRETPPDLRIREMPKCS